MVLRFTMLAMLLLALGACSRPEAEQSKVSISLPGQKEQSKVGAMSGEVLGHVVINVTGSGMAPFVFNWDGHQNGATATPPPSEFAFEFQQGSARLVQVLAVYKDMNTQAMSFYYGETTADFNTSSVTLFVRVSSLVTGFTTSGRLSGRYLTTSNSGPTGEVTINYTPPGRPDMIIERSSIYNGWFAFFGLSDIPMSYRLSDGSLLFGGAKSLNDFAASESLAKLQIPLHKYEKQTAGYYEVQEPMMSVWGWFGPGSAGKKICIGELSPALSGPLKYSNTSAGLDLTVGSVTTESLFNTSTGAAYTGAAYYSGGVAYSHGSYATPSYCGGTEYEQQLTLTGLAFSNARDGGGKVLAPMVPSSDGIAVGKIEGLYWNSGTNELSGGFLPDVVPGTINKLALYFVPTTEQQRFQNINHGEFPCIQAAGSSLPRYEFSLTNSEFILDFDSIQIGGMSLLNHLTSGATMGFCFMKDGQSYPRGFYSGNSGSSSVSPTPTPAPTPYLRLEFAYPAVFESPGDYLLETSQCYVVIPRVFVSGSLDSSYSGSVSVAASSNFCTDNTCSACNAATSSTITSGVGSSLYYKAVSTISPLVQLGGVTVVGGASWSPNNNRIRIEDVCLGSPTPGTVCAGGTIYLGSLTPGATSGSGTDRYMTTPGGCGEIPAGQQGGGSGASIWPNADFTPTCSGTDSLTKYWDDGATNWYDIPGLTNYLSTAGIGYGASNTDQYYGSENTTIIVAITATGEGGYHAAARYCDKLVIGGYSDWYLPNRYELNLMYTNKASIPGLDVSGSSYWASTEYSNLYAWEQRFSDGIQGFYNKYNNYRLRCVRRF